MHRIGVQFFTVATLLIAPAGAVIDSIDSITRTYAHSWAYRTGPVIKYIENTKPWKQGKQDILDYGSGGGALAARLAEKGAGNVVAVDIDQNTVNVANRRLQSCPSATARGDNAVARFLGGNFRGIIGYISAFDIIVSYRGALNGGTVKRSTNRINCISALGCAVRACRPGGSIIIVETHWNYDIKPCINFVAVCLVGVIAKLGSSFKGVAANLVLILGSYALTVLIHGWKSFWNVVEMYFIGKTMMDWPDIGLVRAVIVILQIVGRCCFLALDTFGDNR